VRKRLAAWAVKSESEPGLRRLLILAQSEAELIIQPEQLDADVFLLNTPTGTVELRTAHLRPHRREDCITKITAAPYLAGARHRMWDEFLETVLPDEDTRAYLQRFAGYSLTGDTSEEKFGSGHGATAGGKTTFAMALRNAMGEYAGIADITTFCTGADGRPLATGGRRASRGLRLVAAEVEAGSSLAAGSSRRSLVDKVVARHLYKASREFGRPSALAHGEPPARAPDDDDALWRRVVESILISIPADDRDPAVKATLTNPEGRRGLAWAVEGAALWFGEASPAEDCPGCDGRLPGIAGSYATSWPRRAGPRRADPRWGTARGL
jgi:putative DNA primase/helicase